MGEVNKFGIGAKCTFLRLAGCNIRCYKKTMFHLCDTPESLEGTDGEPMEVDEIIAELKALGNNVICLTGGEPLIQKPFSLIQRLSEEHFYVVVETNGTVDITPYKGIQNVTFIVDYKAISTGESGLFRSANFSAIGPFDYLKFVIHDWADYTQMLEVYSQTKAVGLTLNFSAGLFWGSEIGYQELMARIIKDKLNISLNMQTHKMAVLYDAQRGDLKKHLIPRNL